MNKDTKSFAGHHGRINIEVEVLPWTNAHTTSSGSNLGYQEHSCLPFDHYIIKILSFGKSTPFTCKRPIFISNQKESKVQSFISNQKNLKVQSFVGNQKNNNKLQSTLASQKAKSNHHWRFLSKSGVHQ